MARRSQAKSQLCLNNRIKINTGIILGMSAITIAKQLKVSRQTIYREIKRNRKMVKRRTSSNKSVFCKHRNDCPYKATMRHQGFTVCFEKCEHFEDDICDGLLKFPFCCNTCSKRHIASSRNITMTWNIRKNRPYKGVPMSERNQNIQRWLLLYWQHRFGRTQERPILGTHIEEPQGNQGQCCHHQTMDKCRIYDCKGHWFASEGTFKVSKDYVPRVVKNPELMVGKNLWWLEEMVWTAFPSCNPDWYCTWEDDG